jgi:hypothetical protein
MLPALTPTQETQRSLPMLESAVNSAGWQVPTAESAIASGQLSSPTLQQDAQERPAFCWCDCGGRQVRRDLVAQLRRQQVTLRKQAGEPTSAPKQPAPRGRTKPSAPIWVILGQPPGPQYLWGRNLELERHPARRAHGACCHPWPAVSLGVLKLVAQPVG